MSSQPQCPKCAARIRDDYGMVECPACGVFVFVDMDGVAHISSGAEESTEPVAFEEPLLPLAETVETPETPETFDTGADSFTFQGSADLASPSEQQEDRVPISDASPEAPSESVAESGELNMDALLGFDQQEPGEPPAEEFGAPGDPLGLNEYANSEISQAKDGLLTFKILISGIDSKEMRESLRSALDDQRFGWDPNELIARISKGVLQIDNVASVKAVILISRIKRMPVKVRWEQYAITQVESR